jgi:hypothetical protein
MIEKNWSSWRNDSVFNREKEYWVSEKEPQQPQQSEGRNDALEELVLAAEDAATRLDELAYEDSTTGAAESAERLWEAIEAVGREYDER